MAASELVAGALEAIQKHGQIGAESCPALQGDQGAERRHGCPRDSVRLTRRRGDCHGVAVDPVRIPQVDEANGRRPHGRPIPGRGNTSLVPRLPEVRVVADKCPNCLPYSPDGLPCEALGQIVGIQELIPQVLRSPRSASVAPCLSSVQGGGQDRIRQPHRHLRIVGDCSLRPTPVSLPRLVLTDAPWPRLARPDPFVRPPHGVPDRPTD